MKNFLGYWKSDFSGDKLSHDANGNTLIRRGEEKGLVYEVKYAKTNETLPARCSQVIKGLQ